MTKQLPEPFEITQPMRDWAELKVPTLDIEYYHEEFCDHWWANGKKKKDWFATWRNWMRRTDNGSAPGVYLPNVKRIKPRRSSPQVAETEQRWAELDSLRTRAMAAGVGVHEVRFMTVQELKEAIGE